MNIVLISTSDVSTGRSEALDRLLASIARTERLDISIVLLLLLQNCPAGLASAKAFPAFVDVSSIPHQKSLSAARNLLLSRALSCGLVGSTTVVGFPDDDCWYPQGTLEYIADQFSHAPELDLWFCRYSSNSVSAAEVGITPKLAGARDVVRHLSSTTMFVRGRIIQSGAFFDENLGLGTRLGGGEDTEFGLHAHSLAKQTMHFNVAAVGHRDRNPQRRAKYWQGGLVAIAKYAQGGGVVIELMRKIAVGGWLTLRSDLSVAEFLGALSAAFRAWRSAN